MVIFRHLLSACFFVMALSGLSFAGISEFHISQAWVELPDITVYLHVNDAGGSPVTEPLRTAQVMAGIGTSVPGLTPLRPFDPEQEGVAVIFLVDISKSLHADQFNGIKKAMSLWVASMGQKDRACVISFGSGVNLLQEFTGDRAVLQSAVEKLSPTDTETQLHQGLVRAMEAGKRRDAGIPHRRAIMILSDGQDDFAGGITREEVLNRMETDPVPIYAIGFYRSPRTREKEEGLKTLGQFARTSGGNFFRADTAASIQDIYLKVHKNIKETQVVTLNCPECRDDGMVYRLQMSLTENGTTITDGMNIRMLPKIISGAGTPSGNLQPFGQEFAPWVYGLSGMVIFFLLCLLIVLRRKRLKNIPTIPPAADLSDPFSAAIENKDIKSSGDIIISGPLTQTTPLAMQSVLAVRLVMMGKGENNPVHELRIIDSATLGRERECDLAIPHDDEISATHCRLMRSENGEGVNVMDLNSTNGTLVNGVPVTDVHHLQSGDVLLIGRSKIRILF